MDHTWAFVISLRETRDFYLRLMLRSWRKGIIGFGLAGGLTAWYYITALKIQVSTPVEITLTDAEPSSEFVTACTELWTDPAMSDIPSVRGGVRADRVDFCGDKPLSARIVE